MAINELDHLRKNGLNSLQSASRLHHSCEIALVQVQNDILCSIDDNHCVVKEGCGYTAVL